MADLAERRMTVEEFLDWHDGTGTRHMLVDGVVVAMEVPSARHSGIAGSAVHEIGRRLEHPWGVLVGAGLRLPGENCVQVDVAVTCETIDRRRLMEQPVLLVEVLSPTTRRDDLGFKIPAYEDMGSVREIWAVESEQRAVRVWRRTEGGWVKTLPIRAGGFRSEVLDDEIALDELYAGTGL